MNRTSDRSTPSKVLPCSPRFLSVAGIFHQNENIDPGKPGKWQLWPHSYAHGNIILMGKLGIRMTSQSLNTSPHGSWPITPALPRTKTFTTGDKGVGADVLSTELGIGVFLLVLRFLHLPLSLIMQNHLKVEALSFQINQSDHPWSTRKTNINSNKSSVQVSFLVSISIIKTA